MKTPHDHLPPLWRREPNGTGVGSIALDPREAEYVVGRGWAKLNGELFKVLYDWDAIVEGDGRVSVRIERK